MKMRKGDRSLGRSQKGRRFWFRCSASEPNRRTLRVVRQRRLPSRTFPRGAWEREGIICCRHAIILVHSITGKMTAKPRDHMPRLYNECGGTQANGRGSAWRSRSVAFERDGSSLHGLPGDGGGSELEDHQAMP
jgi:hypothetical protein